MIKESISMRGAFAIIVLIEVSNSLILGIPNDTGTNTWLSLLVTMAISMPLMLLYARLTHLLPQKDIFEMAQFVYGRFGSIFVGLLYAFYFICLAALVRGYYAEFVHLTSLRQTPFIVILFAFLIVCGYIAKSGVQTLGKWCSLILFCSSIVVLLIFLLSISKMKLENLLPLRTTMPLSEIVTAGAKGVILPVGESIVIFSFFGKLEKKVNPYKLFIFSLLFATLFVFVVYIQNLAVLGEEFEKTAYFPLFTSASVIHVGPISTRIENLATFTFLLAGISKVASSLSASTIAVARVFRLENNRPLVLSMGFFSVALSAIALNSILELFDFMKSYIVFAFPFQIIIPFLLWLGAEIKIKKSGQKPPKIWREPATQPAGE